MDRVFAYSIVARKIAEYRSRGYGELMKIVGAQPIEELTQSDGEPVLIAVRAEWARSDPRAIVIEVSAYGQLGTLDDQIYERVVIQPPSL
jgi:hypothetical protein